MDRYDFASVVDDIFKECTSIEEACSRYSQLKNDLDSLFKQNIALLTVENKEGGVQE